MKTSYENFIYRIQIGIKWTFCIYNVCGRMFSIYNKTWDSTLKYSKHAVGKSQYMKQKIIHKFLGAITEPYEKNTQGKLCTYDT